jgi:hypothetical protein
MFDNIPLFKNFVGNAAIYAYIHRKVDHYAGEFLDKVGERNLITCVEKGIWLTDRMAEEEKVRLKMMAMPYRNIVSVLDPPVVFTWLPERHIKLFRAIPNGEAWAVHQLQIIKDYLCS